MRFVTLEIEQGINDDNNKNLIGSSEKKRKMNRHDKQMQGDEKRAAC
jgi:hypothetical protein